LTYNDTAGESGVDAELLGDQVDVIALLLTGGRTHAAVKHPLDRRTSELVNSAHMADEL